MSSKGLLQLHPAAFPLNGPFCHHEPFTPSEVIKFGEGGLEFFAHLKSNMPGTSTSRMMAQISPPESTAWPDLSLKMEITQHFLAIRIEIPSLQRSCADRGFFRYAARNRWPGP